MQPHKEILLWNVCTFAHISLLHYSMSSVWLNRSLLHFVSNSLCCGLSIKNWITNMQGGAGGPAVKMKYEWLHVHMVCTGTANHRWTLAEGGGQSQNLRSGLPSWAILSTQTLLFGFSLLKCEGRLAALSWKSCTSCACPRVGRNGATFEAARLDKREHNCCVFTLWWCFFTTFSHLKKRS